MKPLIKEYCFLLTSFFVINIAMSIHLNKEFFNKESLLKFETDATGTAGLLRFARRVFQYDNKANYVAPKNNGCSPANKSKCRNVFELISLAYDKARRFMLLLSFESCRKSITSKACELDHKSHYSNTKSVYMLTKDINLQDNQTSRFTLGITPHNDFKSTTNEFGETILFKICIPVNKDKEPWLSFKCAYDPCDPSKKDGVCSDQ